VARFAVRSQLDDELIALLDQLALHVRAQVEVAAVGHPLQFAELAAGQERKVVLDVGRAAPSSVCQRKRRSRQ